MPTTWALLIRAAAVASCAKRERMSLRLDSSESRNLIAMSVPSAR
jgi:hypothetical protein